MFFTIRKVLRCHRSRMLHSQTPSPSPASLPDSEVTTANCRLNYLHHSPWAATNQATQLSITRPTAVLTNAHARPPDGLLSLNCTSSELPSHPGNSILARATYFWAVVSYPRGSGTSRFQRHATLAITAKAAHTGSTSTTRITCYC
jgi:hypothetical protein